MSCLVPVGLRTLLLGSKRLMRDDTSAELSVTSPASVQEESVTAGGAFQVFARGSAVPPGLPDCLPREMGRRRAVGDELPSDSSAPTSGAVLSTGFLMVAARSGEDDIAAASEISFVGVGKADVCLEGCLDERPEPWPRAAVGVEAPLIGEV